MLKRLAVQTKSRPDVARSRALFVAALIVFWMLGIGVRLVYLQVSRHGGLIERARQQQQNTLQTTPQRGSLLDRQERELARSVDTVSIFVAPNEFDRESDGDLICTTGGLANELGLDRVALSNQIRQAQLDGRQFIWIARRLEAERVNSIAALNLPGLHFRSEPKRYYPHGSLAAHVLGFVGLDGIGLGGLEQTFNERISGEPGQLFLERDSTGRAYESSEITAKPGQVIALTLDQSIQYRVEQALAAAVRQSRAKSGTAIVLDPSTGDILALANVPVFDPNNVGATPATARRNGALENTYEPGSTFKIVAFSAAIEKGIVKPEDKIECQMGAITVAGRVVHDHHPFGTLTIAEALAKSSNVAAIKLGVRLGDPTMFDYITRFGFGSRTGVELPGEASGILRPVQRWQASSIGSIAIGQEIGVTPLQMAAAFGALANNGLRVSPHLVREIRSPSGTVIYRPKSEERRVISPETALALRGMLENVTVKGTAKKAQLDGYTAAGKTGTAQKIDPQTKRYSKTKHVASFVGFAPVGHPEVVIVVVIDEPAGAYHGGDVAAPVFREIAQQVLPILAVTPDQRTNAPPELMALAGRNSRTSDSDKEAQIEELRQATWPTVVATTGRAGEVVYAASSNNAIVMPDLRGKSVRDVARACARLGLQVEAHGEGLVVRQCPAPGAEVEPGVTVFLDFDRAN